MNGRTVAAILLVIVLGDRRDRPRRHAPTTPASPPASPRTSPTTGSGVVVAPGYAAAPYVGWGWGWGNGGFGFFGFLGVLCLPVHLFGLIRAAFGWAGAGVATAGGPGPAATAAAGTATVATPGTSGSARSTTSSTGRAAGPRRRGSGRSRPARRLTVGAAPRAAPRSAPASATEAGASASLLYDAPAMKTILVVDDEPKIAAARPRLPRARRLRASLVAGDGRGGPRRGPPAPTRTSSSSTSGLPGLDGLDVTRELRARLDASRS